MSRITEQATVEEVATIDSVTLDSGGITVKLAGNSTVTNYSNDRYLSR